MSKKDDNWGWGLAAGLAALVGGAWLISEAVNSQNKQKKIIRTVKYKCPQCNYENLEYGIKNCPQCGLEFNWEATK